MTALEFIRKHKDDAIRIIAGAFMCGLVVLLMCALKNGDLPHAADGDAFESIYAIDDSQQTSHSPNLAN